MGLEAVVENLVCGHLHPVGVEVDRAVLIGVPDRPRRRGIGLDDAVAQAGHGAAFGAVHLQSEQVVAADADSPGGIEVRDDAVLQFKGRVG